jgi:hypothetical protein
MYITLTLIDTEEGHLLIENFVNIFFVTPLSVSLHNLLDLYIYIFIYVWKLNQTVLELDFRAVKFLFFPRRDLNPHHCYTTAPIRLALRPAP